MGEVSAITWRRGGGDKMAKEINRGDSYLVDHRGMTGFRDVLYIGLKKIWGVGYWP